VSNSIGDPYNDSGKYYLRSASVLDKKNKPFVNMHGNRSVKKSEFEYMYNGLAPPKLIETKKGLHINKNPEPFTSLNKIGYSEDPYERKEDIIRAEYASNNSKIYLRN